jgi:hypothetical protein
MEDFSMRLSGMVQHLATLGEIVEEPKVVSKFLWCVPHRYRQIAVVINTLLDVKTLSLVNVTVRLKASEDDLEAPPASVNHAGKLYLSEEAWEEKWKLREGSGSGGGSSSRGGGGGGCGAKRGSGRGFGGNDRESAGSSLSGPGKVGRDQCRKCGRKGHWARDCKSKPKKDATYTARGVANAGDGHAGDLDQRRAPGGGGARWSGGTPCLSARAEGVHAVRRKGGA